jgi:hypothetical protein
MTEQKESYKNFIEDVARIWLEYVVAYSVNGIDLEDEVTNPMTGETMIQIVNVPQSALKELQATVKIDVTPKSVYDKFAQEQSLENFLTGGFFNIQRIVELKAYANSLDDDSVTPKQKLLEVIKNLEEEQQKIAMIESQAQMMQQRALQFIMEDPSEQANQISAAEQQIMRQAAAGRGGVAEKTAQAEAEIDNKM